MDTIIQQRVMNLMLNGESELAAQILTEYARIKLPDTHPSKRPGTNGVLEGDKALQISQFDREADELKDGIAFGHVIFAGVLEPEHKRGKEDADSVLKSYKGLVATVVSLTKELTNNHKGIVRQLTKALTQAKIEAGIMPSLPEGEAKLVEGDEAPSETTDEE